MKAHEEEPEQFCGGIPVDNIFKNYLRIMEQNNITGTNFKLGDFRGTLSKIVKPPKSMGSDVWCRSPKNQKFDL